jgi:hypothetical protein
MPYSDKGDQFIVGNADGSAGNLTYPSENTGNGLLSAVVLTHNHHLVVPSYYKLELKLNDLKMYICGDVMRCGCDSVMVYKFRNYLEAPEL